MTTPDTQRQTTGHLPPALARDAAGRIVPASLADLLQWFLSYDERVAVVRFPAVEALFQWKQQETLKEQPEACAFQHAEDRFAVGIMQALVDYSDERALHGWMGELLEALDEATKINEELAVAYNLHADEEHSVMAEAEKLPSRREREVYLTCCWLETLCTAELRVLGWIYQQLYGRAFHPENF